MRRFEIGGRRVGEHASRRPAAFFIRGGVAARVGLVLVLAAALVSGMLLVELWKSPESASRLIERVRVEKAHQRRADLAEQLARLVQADPNAVGDEQVAGLTAMLGDDADSVRAWTAGALGFIGPRAASAIPALEAARQKQAEADLKFPVSLSSVAAIDLALRRIRGRLDAGLPGTIPAWVRDH